MTAIFYKTEISDKIRATGSRIDTIGAEANLRLFLYLSEKTVNRSRYNSIGVNVFLMFYWGEKHPVITRTYEV